MNHNGNGNDDEHDSVMETPRVPPPRPSAPRIVDRPTPQIHGVATAKDLPIGEPDEVTLIYIAEQLRHLNGESIRRDREIIEISKTVDRIEGNQGALTRTIATHQESTRASLAAVHAKVDGQEGALRLVRAELREDIAEVRGDTLDIRHGLTVGKNERAEIRRQITAHQARFVALEKQAARARSIAAPRDSQREQQESERDSKREEILMEAAQNALAISHARQRAELEEHRRKAELEEARQRAELARVQDEAEAKRAAKAMARTKMWKLIGYAGTAIVGLVVAVLMKKCGG